MTHQQEEAAGFPYYRSPNAIRSEAFSHRVRGFDEAEVREFLDLLADQVQAGDAERRELRTEIERLTLELERLRAQPQAPVTGESNPHALLVLRQAQQVADQLVEEAVDRSRQLMASARDQRRAILEQAHEAGPAGAPPPAPDLEYVRTLARTAQVQLRSVLDALSEQADLLGQLPAGPLEGRSWYAQETTTRVVAQHDWRMGSLGPRPRDVGP